MLIIEVDGLEAGLDAQARARSPTSAAKQRRPRSAPGRRRDERAAAALEVPQAGVRRRRPAEPQLLHAGRRRAAHQAAAHPAAHHARSARSTASAIVNVFHAGDGNIHPILLFDERDAEQVERVLAASDEILDECIACGGSVTGEHGIGVEKIDFMLKLMFSERRPGRPAAAPRGLRPRSCRANPYKIYATGAACVEVLRPMRRRRRCGRQRAAAEPREGRNDRRSMRRRMENRATTDRSDDGDAVTMTIRGRLRRGRHR